MFQAVWLLWDAGACLKHAGGVKVMTPENRFSQQSWLLSSLVHPAHGEVQGRHGNGAIWCSAAGRNGIEWRSVPWLTGPLLIGLTLYLMAFPESLTVSLSSFTLIALAEVGDKSQLVCLSLATRHRHWPVILGAAAAFALLNLLAVLFGAGVAVWVPEQVMAGLVALLFSGFGIHALLAGEEVQSEAVEESPGHGIFLTTLLLILVAEFGDKTQIAVAGLAGNLLPLPVWIGATLALLLVSGLGVWAGRTLLQRLPLHWLHRASGVIFILFGVLAAWRAAMLSTATV